MSFIPYGKGICELKMSIIDKGNSNDLDLTYNEITKSKSMKTIEVNNSELYIIPSIKLEPVTYVDSYQLDVEEWDDIIFKFGESGEEKKAKVNIFAYIDTTMVLDTVSHNLKKAKNQLRTFEIPEGAEQLVITFELMHKGDNEFSNYCDFIIYSKYVTSGDELVRHKMLFNEIGDQRQIIISFVGKQNLFNSD